MVRLDVVDVAAASRPRTANFQRRKSSAAADTIAATTTTTTHATEPLLTRVFSFS
jgi:hypothetical protein